MTQLKFTDDSTENLQPIASNDTKALNYYNLLTFFFFLFAVFVVLLPPKSAESSVPT